MCSVDRCAEGRLARKGTRKRLTLTWPLGDAFPAGSQVFIANRVRYYLGTDQHGRPSLMRDVDGGASSLIGNVATFELAYLDHMGQPTRDPVRAARVCISIALGDDRDVIVSEVGLRV